MAEQDMKQLNRTYTQLRNEEAVISKLQSKAKHDKEKVRPIIPGTEALQQKVYHTIPISNNAYKAYGDKPISSVYPVIDNDLARDNIENNIPAADLQDL